MYLLDHCGFQQLRVSCGGKEFSEFLDGQFHDLSARFLDQGFRTAHDQFDVAAVSVLSRLIFSSFDQA